MQVQVAQQVQINYNTGNGPQASTTGNVTGVYDMSGGAYEYVTAYVNNKYAQSGQPPYARGQSLIDSVNAGNTKYADVYSVGSSDSQSNNYTALNPSTETGHYGDAIWETSDSSDSPYINSWYSDIASFSYDGWLFFNRGGGYNGDTGAGMFFFCYIFGGANNDVSFHIVIPVL